MPVSATDTATALHTLAIDIGGSHLKAGVLDDNGIVVAGPARVVTPAPAAPDAVISAIVELTRGLAPFARVSIGFPGMVRDGTILTAPNLGTRPWQNFPFAATMSQHLGKPVRVLNDAAIQGLGVISGQGLECVITLGTGMGFSLFRNGQLTPHMELGQHIAHGDKNYDQYVGEAGLRAAGRKRWNRRVRKVVGALNTLLNYDMLYIGGGNAMRIDFDLPRNVHIVSNEAGVTGGVRLWDPTMEASFADESLATARA